MARRPLKNAMRLLLARLLVPLSILLLAGPARAQGALQMADLNQCRLVNGEVIQHCRLGYRTFGTLNADRSNAVLFPTWFSGTSNDLIGNVGPNALVDSTRFFVILVDAFGNGVSSSPSTSTTQPERTFPTFSIRDMVDAQHRLLTETLQIDHLHAVVGASMGGMQAFEWMMRYPSFMDKVAALTGTPRLTPYDRLLWQAELTAIESGSASRQAMRTVALIHARNLYTPQRFAHMDSARFASFYQQEQEHTQSKDPYDWASQLRAMLHHDSYEPFEGDIAKAASAIQADVLVVTAQQDHMVNPLPAQRFAERIGAKQLTLPSDCGHLALGCQADTVNPTVRRFLSGR